ncbi:MAG: hypothetical protein D6778_07485 [Nitrospirae bacterium]|nr:MAG: hypothetical protein D6778_07485 [Nitrospirota bacterium]
MFLDVKEFLEELSSVYRDLDRAYQDVAGFYGLSCEGCQDNCCQSPFFVNTLVEHLYLMEGLHALTEAQKAEVFQKANAYQSGYSKTSRPETNFRMFCPLNRDQKCILYEYRPMMCRVYGVPGVMQSPRGGTVEFPGCQRFGSLGKEITRRLQRTEYYQRVAQIEANLRKKLVYHQKYKKTIAQAIIDEEREKALIMRGYDIFEGY